MKLPNAHIAIVEREKVADYLLNPAHPDNGGKAAFFIAGGFYREEWGALAEALRALGVAGEVVNSLDSPHGLKYILDGEITSPRGHQSIVRTIWIIDHGSDAPRLVTAYPHEK